MIFEGKIWNTEEKVNRFAFFPKVILGNKGNYIWLFMQRYQLRLIDCAHGEVYVNCESIGKDYWDH